MENHPYLKYVNEKEWAVVERAVLDLVENQDIKLFTPPDYIIGYICKKLDDEKLIRLTDEKALQKPLN